MENIDDFSISVKKKLNISPITAKATININYNVFPKEIFYTKSDIRESLNKTVDNLKIMARNSFEGENCDVESDEEGAIMVPKIAISFIDEKRKNKFTILKEHKLNYIEHALSQKEIYVQYEAIYSDTNKLANNASVNEQLKKLLEFSKNYCKTSKSMFKF